MLRRRAGFLWMAFVLLIAACGSSGGDPYQGSSEKETTDFTGVFMDRNVRGLDYKTSPGGYSGTTGEKGEFAYHKGDTVSFFLGDLLIGSGAALSVMTPVDLVPGAEDETDQQVTNICRLLQTLDFDDNPDNGIEISSATARAVSGTCLDFSMDGEDFADCLQELLDVLNAVPGLYDPPRAMRGVSEVQAHLKQTLLEGMAGDYKGTFSGDFSGTWVADVSPDGSATGQLGVNEVGSYTGNGTVASSGAFGFGLGTVTGRLHPSSTEVNGTYDVSGYTGTFTGERQTRYDPGVVIQNDQAPDE